MPNDSARSLPLVETWTTPEELLRQSGSTLVIEWPWASRRVAISSRELPAASVTVSGELVTEATVRGAVVSAAGADFPHD
jgi:hypothetical protein